MKSVVLIIVDIVKYHPFLYYVAFIINCVQCGFLQYLYDLQRQIDSLCFQQCIFNSPQDYPLLNARKLIPFLTLYPIPLPELQIEYGLLNLIRGCFSCFCRERLFHGFLQCSLPPIDYIVLGSNGGFKDVLKIELRELYPGEKTINNLLYSQQKLGISIRRNMVVTFDNEELSHQKCHAFDKDGKPAIDSEVEEFLLYVNNEVLWVIHLLLPVNIAQQQELYLIDDVEEIQLFLVIVYVKCVVLELIAILLALGSLVLKGRKEDLEHTRAQIPFLPLLVIHVLEGFLEEVQFSLQAGKQLLEFLPGGGLKPPAHCDVDELVELILEFITHRALAQQVKDTVHVAQVQHLELFSQVDTLVLQEKEGNASNHCSYVGLTHALVDQLFEDFAVYGVL